MAADQFSATAVARAVAAALPLALTEDGPQNG